MVKVWRYFWGLSNETINFDFQDKDKCLMAKIGLKGPSANRVKIRNCFRGLLIDIKNFCFEDYVVFRLF